MAYGGLNTRIYMDVSCYPGDSISTVEGFDPIVGRWQISEPMTTLRSRVGVAVLKGMTSVINLLTKSTGSGSMGM